jgi:hypothetical protein
MNMRAIMVEIQMHILCDGWLYARQMEKGSFDAKIPSPIEKTRRNSNAIKSDLFTDLQPMARTRSDSNV